jgi:hypothetical protein
LLAAGIVIWAVRARRDIDVERQRISARHAAWWMHDDRLAHGVAFGMQRLLHDQRAAVRAPRERRAPARVREAEREARRASVRPASRALRRSTPTSWLTLLSGKDR